MLRDQVFRKIFFTSGTEDQNDSYSPLLMIAAYTGDTKVCTADHLEIVSQVLGDWYCKEKLVEDFTCALWPCESDVALE